MSLIQLSDNMCPICFDEDLKWHYNAQKSQVEVFKCNHFTCKDCYQKMKRDFCCPLCRTEGQYYIKTIGVVADKPWNTLDEWKIHFHIYLPHTLNCNVSKIPRSSFGLVYRGLIQKAQDHTFQKQKDNKRKAKITEQNAKSKKKADNRKNAVCKCGTHCTSILQMKKHMNSNKCIKLQRKKAELS